MEIKIINNLDEIKSIGKYAKIGYESQWIEIDFESCTGEEKEYTIFGMVSGSRPTGITKNGYILKSWKTINGVVGSLKKYATDGSWGMGHWK